MATNSILDFFFGLGKDKPKKTSGTRKHPRLKAFNLIKFSLSNGASYESLSNVVDISETGLQFTCYEELQPDQEIHMVIHIPHANEEAPVDGRLVWVKKLQTPRGVYVSGVHFHKISERHRELIREMIEKGRGHRSSRS